ncbi:unnamed protein product [Prunus armeniaca]
MEKMKVQDNEAYKWLLRRPPKNWSRSHFDEHYKYDILLNNLCETFNSCILEARDKVILTRLERIRTYVMLRMCERRTVGRVWKHPVGPRIVKIIENYKKGAHQCIPKLAGEKKYQVSHMYGDQWKKINLPLIRPPPYKTQPGRPKKSRNKDPSEVEVRVPVPPNPIPPNYIPPPAKLRRVFIKITCSICGQEGHNKIKHFKQGDAANSSNQGDQSNGSRRPAIGRGRGVHKGPIKGGCRGKGKQPSSSSVGDENEKRKAPVASQPLPNNEDSSFSSPSNNVQSSSQLVLRPPNTDQSSPQPFSSPHRRFQSSAKKIRPPKTSQSSPQPVSSHNIIYKSPAKKARPWRL